MKKIAIIGLGYVGLPLAVEFGKKVNTIGYDINTARVSELNSGTDSTLETTPEELASASLLSCTDNPDLLVDANIYIVTVPTPIDGSKSPDLSPVISATHLVAKYLKQDDIVIYESTVYPGATEDVCVPILEKVSGLKFNTDFYCGYSPERINPGDKERTLTTILKVTSGSTSQVADFVDDLYSSIIIAGTFKAASMKVAEASKAIENAQPCEMPKRAKLSSSAASATAPMSETIVSKDMSSAPQSDIPPPRWSNRTSALFF